MVKKLKRAFFIAMSTFVIMPAGNTFAAQKESSKTNIVNEASIQKDNMTAASYNISENTNEDYDFIPANIKAKNAKKKIYLENTSDTILVDDKAVLNLLNVSDTASVSFKSSNESILEINELSNTSCEYKGIASGNAYITIKIKQPVFLFVVDVVTLKYKVNISPRAASIKFNKAQYTISEGKSQKLKLTIRPSISKEQPEFDISNPKVISINSKGKVSGKSEGTSFVTASISNGKTAKCKVIVN